MLNWYNRQLKADLGNSFSKSDPSWWKCERNLTLGLFGGSLKPLSNVGCWIALSPWLLLFHIVETPPPEISYARHKPRANLPCTFSSGFRGFSLVHNFHSVPFSLDLAHTLQVQCACKFRACLYRLARQTESDLTCTSCGRCIPLLHSYVLPISFTRQRLH